MFPLTRATHFGVTLLTQSQLKQLKLWTTSGSQILGPAGAGRPREPRRSEPRPGAELPGALALSPEPLMARVKEKSAVGTMQQFSFFKQTHLLC